MKIEIHNPNNLPTIEHSDILFQKEQWENIKGYENYYQVSNLGSVRSLSRYVKGKNGNQYKNGKILKSNTDKYGYLYYVICKHSICKSYKAHRLVLLAFKENPNNYPECNHLDGNKKNNYIKNLEWCDKSTNEKHAYKIGLKNSKGEKHSQAKLKSDDIKNIRKLRNVYNLTYKRIGDLYHISYGYAREIAIKEAWNHIK